MDLRQLQTLLVVAQTGSLKKAAARFRLVETALSHQIRLLEIELLDRTSGPTALLKQ